MADILVVEDEHQIAEVIAAYLKREGHSPHLCYTGAEALEYLASEEPDLIILDLMLPDMKGEDICKKIRESSAVPVLILTAKSDETSQLYGFRVGADDYMTKPFSPKLLIARVNALVRRSSGLPKAQTLELDSGRIVFDSSARNVIKEGTPLGLTPLEFDILAKLVSYPKRIFTREEIIESVMGYDFEGSTRTVDSHIRNLRAKIEDTPKEPRIILTSRGRGFYFSG